MFVSGEQLAQWRRAAQENYPAPEEVDWLLRQISDLDSLSLRLESFKKRSHIPLSFSLDELSQLWQKRTQERYPLQYLCGTAPWRHFVLQVSPAVLIPRPETEQMLDIVQALPQSADKSGIWVDLGTGSGAIALALADFLTNGQVYAVDISPEALALAQSNAQNLGLATRLEWRLGHWWQPLEDIRGQIRGMLSNPPYIPTALIKELEPEVANFEPRLALDGGEDGLDCLRYLVETAPEYLESGGIWLIEMMHSQGKAIANLLAQQGQYQHIQIMKDFAGKERFALAVRK